MNISDLRAEIAMLTNSMPARRVESVWAAFRDVEAALAEIAALKAQLTEAERVIEFKDKVITAIETRAEAAEARADAAEKKIIKLEGQIDDAVAQIIKLSAAESAAQRYRAALEAIVYTRNADVFTIARAAIGEGKEVQEGGGE